MFPLMSKYNIDRECDLVNMWKSPEEKQIFYGILEHNCHLKNNCTLSPEALPYNVTIKDKTSFGREDFEEMGVNMTDYDLDLLNSTQNKTDLFYKFDPNGKWAITKVKMSNLISETCYRRIFNEESTSLEYIGIFTCMTDDLFMPHMTGIRFHKEQVGLLSVFIDILSLALMYYLFGKLKSINKEYLTILDNNVIRMKDFTIQIKRLAVDHQTQDMRILKLKIWL